MVKREASIPEMVDQSKMVITRPSVSTFERYEHSGSLMNAAMYVGLASLIAGVLGIAGGLPGLIGGLINALATFFIFTGLVYYIGKNQGGTGTFDEVAYTFSLFIAPLIVVNGIAMLFGLLLGGWFVALVGLAVLLVQAFFAYIAVQSSMNLINPTKSLITLAGAVLGTWIIQLLIGLIF